MAKPDDDGIIVVPERPASGTDTGDGIIVETQLGDNAVTQLADGTIVVEPSGIGGNTGCVRDGNPVKRGRGRPRGTGAGRKSKATGPQVDISGLENILLSAHAMLAGITRVAELDMEQEEAHKLAQAGANVARHYDMATSGKALDWTNLLFVIGEIYGSRVVAIRLRRMADKIGEPETVAPATTRTVNPKPNGTMTRVNIPGVGLTDVPLN